MNNIESFILALDDMLNTKRRRHIVGGILLGVSLLFGTLSATVATIGKDEDDEYEK